MDLISFRCTSCKQGLKIGADKAGRKVKCTKCGAELTIPQPGAEAGIKPAAAPSVGSADAGPRLAPEAPPKPVEEDEEDDKQGYGLLHNEEEEKKPEVKAKKDDKKAAPLKRKFKTLPDPDLWEKVKGGLQIMMIGANIWGGAVLFMVLMVVLGIFGGPDFAEVLQGAVGEADGPDLPKFMLGLVTGTSFQGIGKVFYILAVVLSLFQIIVFMAGYAVCLNVPDRFGAKGQLVTLLCFGGVNFLLVLIFKLLPALGVMNYVLVPYAVPEVSLVDANVDRDLPIWVLWSGSPFWEMILTVLFVIFFYAEPVLVGVFIWSIGLALREDPIVEKGQGVVALAFGICFALISFHLLSMAGTSGVAVGVLRVVYGGWVGFTIFLLIRMPMALQATRVLLQHYLDGAEMKDDEDEEDEDKPKRKRKRARDEDDDDE